MTPAEAPSSRFWFTTPENGQSAVSRLKDQSLAVNQTCSKRDVIVLVNLSATGT